MQITTAHSDIYAGKYSNNTWTTNSGHNLVEDVGETVGKLITPNTCIIYNPFPEGVKIPDLVRESWKMVQECIPESVKQQEISYYINSEGRWCMKITGIAYILMTNEFAKGNPKAGIWVRQGNTYFSQNATEVYIANKGQKFPTAELWQQLEQFFGGCKQLIDILQIPLNGYFHPEQGLSGGTNFCATFWLDSAGKCFVARNTGGGSQILDGQYVRCGLSLRLLDKTA